MTNVGRSGVKVTLLQPVKGSDLPSSSPAWNSSVADSRCCCDSYTLPPWICTVSAALIVAATSNSACPISRQVSASCPLVMKSFGISLFSMPSAWLYRVALLLYTAMPIIPSIMLSSQLGLLVEPFWISGTMTVFNMFPKAAASAADQPALVLRIISAARGHLELDQAACSGPLESIMLCNPWPYAFRFLMALFA